MQARKSLPAIAAVALFAAAAAIPSAAQSRGGGGIGGHSPAGMGGGGGLGGRIDDRPPLGTPPFGGRGSGSDPIAAPPPSGGPNTQSTGSMHGGLQLGPPGRWWDDKSFARSLKLRADQQSRMDSIFEQNRSALLSRYQNLQQAESQMEEISRTPSVDESTLFSGIDRVAQARAELEKANAHMLLMIRREMDPDQIDRLEKHR